MPIEPSPNRTPTPSKKVKLKNVPKRRILAGLLSMAVDILVLVYLMKNLNYRNQQVSATTVHMTVPAMSGDQYISLFETADTRSSLIVAQLLTDFGLRDGDRPPVEIRYNEFMYTTNQSVDNDWIETHSRDSNSTCYVMLMAGLEPDLKKSVASVYKEYIGTSTLVNLDGCGDTLPQVKRINRAYDLAIVVCIIEFCLLFELNLLMVLINGDQPFSKNVAVFYLGFWTLGCGGCIVGYLVHYTRYLAWAARFAPAETAAVNAPASVFARLGVAATALPVGNKMATARPLICLAAYVLVTAVIVPLAWLSATPPPRDDEPEPVATIEETCDYDTDVEMEPIRRVDSASSIASSESLLPSKGKKEEAVEDSPNAGASSTRSRSPPPEYAAPPPQYPGPPS